MANGDGEKLSEIVSRLQWFLADAVESYDKIAERLNDVDASGDNELWRIVHDLKDEISHGRRLARMVDGVLSAGDRTFADGSGNRHPWQWQHPAVPGDSSPPVEEISPGTADHATTDSRCVGEAADTAEKSR